VIGYPKNSLETLRRKVRYVKIGHDIIGKKVKKMIPGIEKKKWISHLVVKVKRSQRRGRR